MLTKFAREFIELGEQLNSCRVVFEFIDNASPNDPDKPLREYEKQQLIDAFNKIHKLCIDLDLPTSREMFESALERDLPATSREFDIYTRALYSEIKNKFFVFVPTHRAKYFRPKQFLDDSTKEAFPTARIELAEAGRCHAVGLYTATVFHCMRAVEIGLRVMAVALQCTFPTPLEQVDWEPMIAQIESKIRAMKDQTKSAQKDADLNFYSEAAMQFS
jgi:hypothetical protein